MTLFERMDTNQLFSRDEERQSHQIMGLQKRLQTLGYDVGHHGADGYFGHDTEQAIKRFQHQHPGAGKDGIADKHFLEALNSAIDIHQKEHDPHAISHAVPADLLAALHLSAHYAVKPAQDTVPAPQSSLTKLVSDILPPHHNTAIAAAGHPHVPDPEIKSSVEHYRHQLVAHLEAAKHAGVTNDGGRFTKGQQFCRTEDGVQEKVAWCAGFNSYMRNEVLHQCGLHTNPLGYHDNALSVGEGAKQYHAFHDTNDIRHGKYQVQPGDTLVLHRNDPKHPENHSAGHVTTVVKVDHDKHGHVTGFECIGGNQRGDKVNERHVGISDPHLVGATDEGRLYEVAKSHHQAQELVTSRHHHHGKHPDNTFAVADAGEGISPAHGGGVAHPGRNSTIFRS